VDEVSRSGVKSLGTLDDSRSQLVDGRAAARGDGFDMRGRVLRGSCSHLRDDFDVIGKPDSGISNRVDGLSGPRRTGSIGSVPNHEIGRNFANKVVASAVEAARIESLKAMILGGLTAVALVQESGKE
jgi:hypothetical protein